MISVKKISPLTGDDTGAASGTPTFIVELIDDGELKTFQVRVEPIEVGEQTIERIDCDKGLTRLLHTRPGIAQSFFRIIGNLYHGKPTQFPVELVG